MKDFWYAHREGQALIVKFRQQRKAARCTYNSMDKDVYVQFKDQRMSMKSNHHRVKKSPSSAEYRICVYIYIYLKD